VGAGVAKDRTHSSRARGGTSVARRACTAALYLDAAPAGCVGVGIDIDIDRHDVMWVCGYWMLDLLFCIAARPLLRAQVWRIAAAYLYRAWLRVDQ
jgi:hypothetical protein